MTAKTNGFDTATAEKMSAKKDETRVYYVGGNVRKFYPIYKMDNGRIFHRNGEGRFYPCPMRENIRKRTDCMQVVEG